MLNVDDIKTKNEEVKILFSGCSHSLFTENNYVLKNHKIGGSLGDIGEESVTI